MCSTVSFLPPLLPYVLGSLAYSLTRNCARVAFQSTTMLFDRMEQHSDTRAFIFCAPHSVLVVVRAINTRLSTHLTSPKPSHFLDRLPFVLRVHLAHSISYFYCKYGRFSQIHSSSCTFLFGCFQHVGCFDQVDKSRGEGCPLDASSWQTLESCQG